MTVIAYRDGVLATDSGQWQDQIIVSTSHQKIYRLPEGMLLAGCGRACDVASCVEWVRDGMRPGERPAKDEDKRFGAFLIDGRNAPPLIIEWDFRPYRATNAPFWAKGAHIEFMLGAMAAGSSAEEAVALAVKWGDSAEGAVQVARFGDAA